MSEGNLEKPADKVIPQELGVPLPEASHEAMNVREAIEAAVIAKNEEMPTSVEVLEETEAAPVPVKEEAKVEPKREESPDPIERIRKETQKRIDKLTARSKSAEEELNELRAENERLKQLAQAPKEEQKKDKGTEKAEPTIEQCEAALEKAIADGDSKFAAQITSYMTKLVARQEREAAEKAFNERNTKQTEAQKKELADWTLLCKDYEPVTSDGKVDVNHPLNLANQNSMLYRGAMELYTNPQFNNRYAGYDKVTGFRLATNDAHRIIMEQGLYKPVQPAAAKIVTRQNQILAEPDAEGGDEAPSQTTEALSDADKVREEINQRNKMRQSRGIPRK